MRKATFDIQLSELRQNPEIYKGRLFVLGGIIVKTTLTAEGSLIEALYVPVDSMGYLKGLDTSQGRFLAIYRGKDILDPVIFREKREITLAGSFIGTRTGRIDELDFTYPFFEIEELYLWEEAREEYLAPPYPSWYYPWYYPPYYPRYHPYWWYDPWWR